MRFNDNDQHFEKSGYLFVLVRSKVKVIMSQMYKIIDVMSHESNSSAIGSFNHM